MNRFISRLGVFTLSALLFGSTAFGKTGMGAVGLHGGFNFSKNNNSLTPGGTASTTDYLVGAFYESSGDLIHFQPEFNYVKKSIANYLSIPLLLKIAIESPAVRPFLVIGPAIGLKVDGPLANTFDLSLDIGGGVGFELIPGLSLLAEARYSLGFVNVSSTAGDIRTRGIYLLVGAAFTL